MGTTKILLADDHLLIRNGIKLLLKDDVSIEVVAEAINGKEAVDYIENNPGAIDLVLMDINMVGMNGVEATEIITNSFRNVKVLALTMHIEESYIKSMLNAGALGYVLKDSDTEQLVTAIKTVALGQKYYSNEVSVTMINYLMSTDEKEKSSDLSVREINVLKCVSNGMTNKAIGELLNISSRTVETHRRNILVKLSVKNTAEMVRYAIQNKIVA
ncbi:MAG: response regulator transcription factor [Vicingaceae bacterium]|nr:response regulator transcription factor [Vicingaceae bacterium]